METSRAATGMFEVLAMRIVRSMRDLPGPRVVELGELGEHVGHLVAALAAADVDDDVGVAPLGERVLGHRLAGAEAAGDGRGAAARDGEEDVDDALPGDQRLVHAHLLDVRPGLAHGPVVRHGHLPRRR